MAIDIEQVKNYKDMTEWQRESAIYSARYILEDLDMQRLSDISGLPMGVISAAFKNIFLHKDAVEEPKRTKRPVRVLSDEKNAPK